MRKIYGPIFSLRPYERGIQETLGCFPITVSSEKGTP